MREGGEREVGGKRMKAARGRGRTEEEDGGRRREEEVGREAWEESERREAWNADRQFIASFHPKSLNLDPATRPEWLE